MTDDARNPELQMLFAEADVDLPGEEFTSRVMTAVGRRRRAVSVVRVIAGLAVFALGLAFAGPLTDLAMLLSRAVSAPLIDLGNSGFAFALAPVNSVGTVISVAAFLTWLGYRKIFT